MLLDQRYSDGQATEVPWSDARERLAGAGVYWLSTVRPDGRPHVTPLIAVWLDDALLFCTGPQERKARNRRVPGGAEGGLRVRQGSVQPDAVHLLILDGRHPAHRMPAVGVR
jgi:hypothetical protein